MDTIYYVSIVAQILTYASFLSGAKVCHLIYQQKSCAKLSAIPFLANLNSNALWFRYGLIADEWEIVAVNLVGLSCQIIYLVFFLAYSRQRARIVKQFVSLIIFLLVLFWFIENSFDSKFLSGSLASLSSLLACVSPLATIKDVLKTKCVASMPFPIILSSFVVSISWLLFGYLKEDNFIVLTNMVSSAMSGAQLCLFAFYPSTHPYEKLSPSNKKSYDLIRLLNSPEEDEDELELESEEINGKDIDTSQNYKETLTRIMGQIYSKRERLSKKQSVIMLLFAN